jgi:antitoxin MazE
MPTLQLRIRKIGNSQGIVVPKPVLAQLGLDNEVGVEMTIEGDALVLRKAASSARAGWAEAARKIAETGDDRLVMGQFANSAYKKLDW